MDRALVTVGGPETLLIDVDLRANKASIEADLKVWETDAFRDTQTGSLSFIEARLAVDAQVGRPGWYLERPGFWHGACGPAACWVGGVAGSLSTRLPANVTTPTL